MITESGTRLSTRTNDNREPNRQKKETTVLSARNQFKGTVKSVKLGNVMAEVVVAVDSIEIVSLISRASAEKLGLKAGDAVTTVIKSTEVIIDK
jgi:molybdopterin-binding protein